MRKILPGILVFILIIFMVYKSYAQILNINDLAQRQADITNKTSIITSLNTVIQNDQNQIATDNADIAIDQAAIAAYNAANAQTASSVNWDYFVTLEPQIPFSTWSKVNSGINWTAIIPTLGITCGGITEANVNWTNWGNCESKGMTPGMPFGGYNTGIASFWCGNGSIAGTC